MDEDPANSLFLDSLQYDIIKAIAWLEYGGSNDTHHCHDAGANYNPHYNNYWDDFISGTDTCRDTKTPCENIGTTASGIMQLMRTTWDTVFTGQMPGEPTGYTRCNWDSTEWNWKINIHDGKYVYFVNNRFHMTPTQAAWDSICSQCQPSDSLPLYKNREDLSTYGYKWGSPAMQRITGNNWVSTMKLKEGKYVRDVRGSKFARPWQ